MSAWSRRTRRLSVTRVKPPVPGSTPRSGTSGRLTADERSSIRTISSQASASSYPPPAVVPLQAAMNLSPEWRLESSMPLRVSLVNLQKLTFHAWLESPSMKMFAPEQKMRSLPLVTTTLLTSGCSKRMRCRASASSMSTPRSYELSLSLYPGISPRSSSMSSLSVAIGPSNASFQCA